MDMGLGVCWEKNNERWSLLLSAQALGKGKRHVLLAALSIKETDCAIKKPAFETRVFPRW
jgi:hypothetical protein